MPVKVVVPGADGAPSPAPGVALVALPYDRDSVLRALEAKAPPRPSMAALDSLYARFRAPFAAYAEVSWELARVQDSLDRAGTALAALPRGDTAWARHDADRQRLDARREALVRRRDSVATPLEAARNALRSPAADSARARLKAWEDSTYAGYGTITSQLAQWSGHEPVTDTTGADGRATLRLRGSRWWIYAKSWDAADPNAEWYWNVPVGRDTVRLDPSTGRRRTRY